MILIGIFVVIVSNKDDRMNEISDYIDLEYDKDYVVDNEDITRYFKEFSNSGVIEMYEYGDTASLQDTLMYYYFQGEDVNAGYSNAYKIIIDELRNVDLSPEMLENNISDVVDILYLLSFCEEKYNLMGDERQLIENIIINVDSYLSSIYSTETFVYRWKVCKLAKCINLDVSCFDDWVNYEEALVTLNNEEHVIEIIHALFEGDEGFAKNLNERYAEMYWTGELDIESYIIYIGLLDDLYNLELQEEIAEDIYAYCMDNFYFVPPMLRFYAFKIDVIYNEFREGILSEYKKMPCNTEGLLPTTCSIIPTYRRLYAYVQICKIGGVDLEQEAIMGWIEQIDTTQMRAEDLYYASLILEEYPDLDIDLNSSIEDLISAAEQVTIGQSNSFSIYSVLKAALCRGIDVTGLYEKYMSYINENSNTVNELELLWQMELEYLNNDVKPNISMLCVSLEEVQDEIKLEYCYYMLNLLLISKSEISDAYIDLISDITNAYRVEGGYYANEEFRYVDIYRTYQCVFINNKITKLMK